MFRPCILAIVRLYCKLNKQLYYVIRKYILPIWSEHKYIFSHRIVHWVYNYMFRPCILAIVRLYCKLNKQLYYIIRKYVLPIWSEHNYIFSHVCNNIHMHCYIILTPVHISPKQCHSLL